MNDIFSSLGSGDFRSIGEVERLVQEVLAEPKLFAELIPCLIADDPVVRMRAADAAEKITRAHPEWLQPYKRLFLEEVMPIPQHEVRWHVAQMLPRLELEESERLEAVEQLFAWLNGSGESKIVRVMALQALADLAETDAGLRARVIAWVMRMPETEAPSLRSRARKLIKKLG